MTNEERDLITRFIARVAGSPQQGGGFMAGPGGSVPQSQPALPPVDREADAFIAQQFQQYPEARYRITQTALVQEAAFAEAQNRIRRLEWELQQTQQAAQQASQQPQQQKGFFGSLFGGGSQGQQQGQQQGRGGFGGQPGYGGQQFQPTSPPPQPQYPPNYQPGMFQQRGGSGFLGSALPTAAGVAGGMFVGNALMNAFSGHGGGGGEGMLGGASTTAFDGAGTDPTAGYTQEASADPFAGGGQPVSYDDGSGFGGGGVQQASYDSDPGGFDQGGGGFDSGGYDENA